MADSIFTKIIKREIPAHIIYEDEMVIAFLDINPVQKGHTLVVPKKQFENIFDGDEESLSHMIRVAKKLSAVIKATVGADGINLIMNNGEHAGQEVFHAHLHIVPRHKGDGSFTAKHCGCYEDNEAAALATQLNSMISENE